MMRLALSIVVTVFSHPILAMTDDEACIKAKPHYEAEGQTQEQCDCALLVAEEYLTPSMKEVWKREMVERDDNMIDAMISTGASFGDVLQRLGGFAKAMMRECNVKMPS